MKRSVMLGVTVLALVIVASACNQSTAPSAARGSVRVASSRNFTATKDFPPDDWIFEPATLDPDFTKYECTFPLASGVTLNDDSACQEKQWGKTGTYREAIRNLHVDPAQFCAHNGPADIDEIRLCNLEWEPGSETPWGALVGGKHCAIAILDLRCIA
jgi:hypothetical protein